MTDLMTTADLEDIIDAEVVEDESIHIAPVALTPRQQQIKELRAFVEMLAANDDVPLPYSWGKSKYSNIQFYLTDARQAANVVKAIGGKWAKNDPNASDNDASNMILSKILDREIHVAVQVSRGLVCERKVVGTEKKKVKKLVSEAVYEEVYDDVEKVEYECGSLLTAAAKLDMAQLEKAAS